MEKLHSIIRIIFLVITVHSTLYTVALETVGHQNTFFNQPFASPLCQTCRPECEAKGYEFVSCACSGVNCKCRCTIDVDCSCNLRQQLHELAIHIPPAYLIETNQLRNSAQETESGKYSQLVGNATSNAQGRQEAKPCEENCRKSCEASGDKFLDCDCNEIGECTCDCIRSSDCTCSKTVPSLTESSSNKCFGSQFWLVFSFVIRIYEM